MDNSNELMRMAQGNVPVTRADRQAVKEAAGIVRYVQKTGLMADGAFALGEHLMERAHRIDALRKKLEGDDPALQLQLSRFQAIALDQAEALQCNLFSYRNEFGL